MAAADAGPSAAREGTLPPVPPATRDSQVSAGAAPASVVGPYLARALSEPAWAECSVTPVAAGLSNLTFVVACAAGEVILRRPPTGDVLPTAHDMVREHRVISALAPTRVPVPRTHLLCTDRSVLGAPFYVMERVEGLIISDRLPDGYARTATERRSLAFGLVDVLADLHAVDPDEVGLGDFGRPEGFMQRQVRRWTRQWEASRDIDRPILDALAAELAASVPPPSGTTVVHGDYRLDNCILGPDRPGTIRAVLDWEMSTLGDPLADLGLLLVYWRQDDDAGDRPLLVATVTAEPGFPDRRALAAHYAERSGRDLDALPWYVAFGFFKLAVVVAGIVARVRAGAMSGKGDAGIASLIDPLADYGRVSLRHGALR